MTSLKRAIDNGKRTKEFFFGKDVVRVVNRYSEYIFPEKYEKELKRKRTGGKISVSNINKRCDEIQRWLVIMSKNKELVRKTLKQKANSEHPYSVVRSFCIALDEIDNVTPFSIECCNAAFDIVPKAWLKENLMDMKNDKK